MRKEVLTVRADKLSPERGQYAFTQSLIRSVAYDMLTRAERKARHLRTAEHLRSAFPDEGAEVAEVIAAHLYDAYRAARDDPDSDELRVRASQAYALAAERAESVGAPEAAESAYLKAAELSSDEAERAGFDRQGWADGAVAGWNERAVGHFEAAIAAHAEAGRVVDAARVTAGLGQRLERPRPGRAGDHAGSARRWRHSRGRPPLLRSSRSFRRCSRHILIFSGHVDEAIGRDRGGAHPGAAPRARRAARLRRSIRRPFFSTSPGAPRRRAALYELSVSVARRRGITRAEMMAEAQPRRPLHDPRPSGGRRARQGRARPRPALGTERHRGAWRPATSCTSSRWPGASTRRPSSGPSSSRRAATSVPGQRTSTSGSLIWRRFAATSRPPASTSRCAEAESDDVQYRAMYAAAEAAVVPRRREEPARARGRSPGDRRGAERRRSASPHEAVRLAFPIALEAAIDVGDLEEAERLAETLATRPPGEVPPFLRAQVIRARALVASARGEDEAVEENLAVAEATFRDLGYPYWAARVQLDRAEWLARQGRLDEAAKLAAEAAATFDAVGAAPVLARALVILELEMARSASGQFRPTIGVLDA